jgi:hypothetical protein
MMKIFILPLLTVMLFLAGCGNTNTIPDEAHARVSVCEAVKIAKTVVPERIAALGTPQTGFRADLGENGTWFMNFIHVSVTFIELGWEGKAADYFKTQNFEQDMPEGVYANITIYVDAETGRITQREISNGIILGPIQTLECD